MTRSISLAWLTIAPFNPLDMIPLAREIGYDGIGLRALPATPGDDLPPLLSDAHLRKKLRSLAAQHEIRFTDMEIIRIDEFFRIDKFLVFLDICAELSIPTVLVAGDDPDLSRLTASFACLCEQGKSRGVSPALEFMPWTSVHDAKTAHSIVHNAATDNGKIIVDTLHVARSSTTLQDLATIPRDHLAYVQICDAPAPIPSTREGLIHTAREARLLPEQGGIELASILETLPKDLPVSIEIPNKEGHARYGKAQWAKDAYFLTQELLQKESLK
ncbi:sugar phosphate isomerase/epimerase [Acetobacter tropicalis]|uniref:sugar phosphate isomerase/epimerase family protein n=1 Tax=Acetobacter tropicalis TaxID=104102 RepID=UPI000555C769|nr:sugar phosphate isomerase/epimerase [Acetobacter tropicalis]KAA8385831.1 sugar phosphate isomerase/epimerase [Acetobacter tropicalis]KAA8391590.1 sugar phosphate isomerase/epimerase [Acetobacter tropicalis]MBC9008752.1 sugar phosphate isomerase/epimerase [Acetobacter tropicalis]MDO8173139.1 sugar phosphate isomerase/epimerase [Acetobacter tropicalis]